MVSADDIINEFKEVVEKRHDYAKAWKERTGGKVVGYFCTYTPEEIFYAADNILPVRVAPGHSLEGMGVVEPYIYSMFCPLCRDCCAQGFLGLYDYLDGICIGQSCIHMRQAFNAWRFFMKEDRGKDYEFKYYIYVPHGVQNPPALPYMAAEVAEFKRAVEKWIGRTLTDADIDRGIKVMNRMRQLLTQLYELRKRDDPPITGTETLYVVLAAMYMDKREYNEKLEQLVKLLPDRKLERQTGFRLMTLSSMNDHVDFISKVEELGSTVVVDDQCTGMRYFWGEVPDKPDRMMAIAERYVLKRIPCPAKDWPERWRVEHIKRLAKEWNVKGALYLQYKFCDPHELDVVATRDALNEMGVPMYLLELDVTVPWGQFRTRIEAFFEALGGIEELF
ncbi:benzoyl-CoA reductase [Candidatus Geothermarchaeota archaeon ex4572_27]|nr:MAG: benzoyl-CoA reductase [Candidatus Geothermarchaeota archaeon ex4572_27]